MNYNMSTIMRNAWKFFKQDNNLTFSECLKMAWRNAKAIAKAIFENSKEECHTWYNWTLLGKEVIHDSKCLFQVVVEDLATRSGYRTLSYFSASQVCELGTQE